MVQILKHNWFIRYRRQGETTEKYWQVKFREVADFETAGRTREFVAVVTTANSGNINLEFMRPNDNEIFFCIPSCKDGCEYILKLPAGTDRWGLPLVTDSGRMDNTKSPYFKPNPRYGFWLPFEQYPTFVAYNDTGASLTPKLYFEILKYEIEEVQDSEVLKDLEEGKIAYTQIEIGGSR